MKNNNNEKGISLVEVLIGMVIMPLILVGIYSILSSSITSSSYCKKVTTENQQAIKAMNMITKDLENATEIAITTSSNGKIGDVLTTRVGTEIMIYHLGNGIDNSTKIIYKNDQPLTSDIVRSILFERTNDDPSIVRITITLNESATSKVTAKNKDTVLTTSVFSANIPKI